MRQSTDVRKKQRGGFTLIEVILAIVVVAVIMGIVIPKVMSNSDKAQIKQVISSDVRSIVQAAADWKRTSSDAGGTYANIKAEYLDSRLPSSMKVEDYGGEKVIKSSGFNKGCKFGLDASQITTAGDSFILAMDCSNAQQALNWNSKLQSYAREAFMDTVKSIGGENVTEYSDSTKIDNIDCSTSGSGATKCAQKIMQ